MRILALAITSALAVAVSIPADAQTTPKIPAYKAKVYTPKRSVAAYEVCETRAHALGMPHGQVGHAEYVRECMGERPRGRNPGS
jgi:hypothetical protein